MDCDVAAAFDHVCHHVKINATEAMKVPPLLVAAWLRVYKGSETFTKLASAARDKFCIPPGTLGLCLHRAKSFASSQTEMFPACVSAVVQQSELEALCQCFPDILVHSSANFNHKVVFRTPCALTESKSHLAYLLAVNAWKGLQDLPWLALRYPFREGVHEMFMNDVCASLQDFDSVRLAVCAELPAWVPEWAVKPAPFQTRWCSPTMVQS